MGEGHLAVTGTHVGGRGKKNEANLHARVDVGQGWPLLLEMRRLLWFPSVNFSRMPKAERWAFLSH